MRFKHATRLLNQRRHEIVQQMERSVGSPSYRKQDGKRLGGPNHEYLKLQAVYKEVEDELRTLESI